MKLALITSALLAGSLAQAGSLEYDVRFDSDNAQYNTAAATADATKMTMQTGRLDYKGKLNDDISYRLRVRFNRDVASSKYSSLGGQIDYASVTHKLMDGLTLTAGKFGSDLGGFEGMTAGADIYFKSQAYQDLDYATTSLPGASGGSARALNLIFQTGAKLAYAYGDNEAALFVTNTDTDSASTTDGQTRPMLGLVWKGKFLDKALQTVLSYATVTPGGLPPGADKHNFATVGVKYDAGAWFAQVDYNLFTYTSVVASGKKDESTTATVAEGGYKFDRHTVKAKLESSEIKYSSAETKKTFSGAGLAYEFKPYADTNFRYHVAYTSRTTSVSGAQDAIESHYVAGIRMVGDFLK